MTEMTPSEGRQPALPNGYPATLAELKRQVRAAQHRAQRTVNTELIRLYWTIGKTILTRQEADGWGAKVIDRLAVDLRAEFPDMKGFSRRNVHYMRAFAAAWPAAGRDFVQQPVAQLPWGHITVLLDKVDSQGTRDWYAAATVEHGWSRAVLLNQIKNRTHARVGAAPSNFADRLPAPESELARDLARDPYVFDFLGLSGKVSERQLEQALIDRLQQTLGEFGHGFAFVGRQYHLDVDGDDFYIDLLFFHVFQLRFVVVELKIDQFRPEYAGKLGFYVAAVDEQVRDKTKHGPTVGLLLCAGTNELIVRYSLANTTAPMAVSAFTYDTLPASEQALLPSEEDVVHALEAPLPVKGQQMTLDEYLEELRRTGELTDEQGHDAAP